MKISLKSFSDSITIKSLTYLNKLFISLDKIGKKINNKSLLTLSKRKDKLFSYRLLKEILVSKSPSKINKKDSNFTLFIKMQ